MTKLCDFVWSEDFIAYDSETLKYKLSVVVIGLDPKTKKGVSLEFDNLFLAMSSIPNLAVQYNQPLFVTQYNADPKIKFESIRYRQYLMNLISKWDYSDVSPFTKLK